MSEPKQSILGHSLPCMIFLRTAIQNCT